MVSFKGIGTTFLSGVGGATTFTANMPTGGGAPAAGDLLLAIGIDWAGAGVTWTTPGGWSLVRNANDNPTGDIGIHVYSKIAAGGDANQNFTLNSTQQGLMTCLCYTSQDTVTPVDTSGATMTDPATASVTLTTPVVTTTIANDILVLIYGVASDNIAGTGVTFATPTGATLRLASVGQQNGGNTNDVQFAVFDIVQAAAGNSAQFSSASTGNGTVTYGAGALVVAIKNAGATPASDSDSATFADATITIASDAQLGLPSADISGTWTQDDLVTTTNLYSRIDESSFSDSDFIQSPQGPANNEQQVRLGALINPGTTANHFVKVRYRKDKPLGSTIDLTVNVYAADGTTLIATRTFSDLGNDGINGVADVAIALTTGEAASIPSADYATGLVLGFKANQTSI